MINSKYIIRVKANTNNIITIEIRQMTLKHGETDC